MFDVKPSTGEIFLYDEIGPEWAGMIDEGMVLDALSQLDGKRALVRINSPGGYVDQGVAIVNALRRYEGGVDTAVDSLAASMASQIMLVGETRTIAANAKVMIHSPRGLAYGTAIDLRKVADAFDIYEKAALVDYVAAMGMEEADVKQLLEDETWYLGEEAVAVGLATDIGLAQKVAPAMVAQGRFKNTPKELIDETMKVSAFGGSLRIAAIQRPTQEPEKVPSESLVRAKEFQTSIARTVKSLTKGV